MAQAWGPTGGLFDRLCAACGADWHAYTRHRFVRELAAGTLATPAFQAYLVQDYLFLFQFARAFALAAFKADSLADLKAAAEALAAIVSQEMALHVRYCASWGLSEAGMAATPERLETIAYTRFVLDRGNAGDVLDLQVALAPCIAGYAEIARERLADPHTVLAGNPYRDWLETYGGADYQAVAAGALAQLDRLAERRGAAARFDALAQTFATATRLETAFWQMGLDAAGAGR